MMHYYWYARPFSFFPSFLFFLFLVLIILVIFWGTSHHDEDDKGQEKKQSDNDYLAIVKERYAKGEIDKKKYEQMRRDLT